MAISLENIKFLHEQIHEQSEKIRYFISTSHTLHLNLLNILIHQMINLSFRFEQLQREEAVQRERADTAEKYKVQLENFIDMICHEIRNPYVFPPPPSPLSPVPFSYISTISPLSYLRKLILIYFRLNGIFGNTDLVLHYLGQCETAQRKQAWMNLPVIASPTSTQRSPAPLTQTHPHSLSLRNNNSTRPLSTPSPQLRLATVQDGSQLDLEDIAGADMFSSCLEQIRICTATIQSCAEHQKRMTDDVLQLSRLRSHKLVVENVYFRPWDMVQMTLQAFRVQADKKVMHCPNLFSKFTHLFCFRDWNCDLSHKGWTSVRRSLGTASGRIRSYPISSPMQSSSH